MSELFRKSAVKNYTDSEKLDRAVRIASPMSWLGIIAAATLILSVGIWSVFGSIPEIKSFKAVITDKSNTIAVHSPTSGLLEKYKIKEGDTVKRGQVAAVVNQSGRKVKLKSPYDGTVGKLLFNKGEIIYAYDEILRLTPDVDGNSVCVSYIPLAESEKIRAGMEAKLRLNSESTALDGEVIAVGDYAASDENMKYVIGRDNSLRNSLTDKKAVVAVVYRIKNKVSVKSGSIISAEIITDNRAPISLFFGFLASGEAKGE